MQLNEETIRTIEQNRQQWPILTAFSRQKEWPINGEKMLISPESWKDILTAAWKKETPKVAVAFDLNAPDCMDITGTVMIGARTSKFKDNEWRDWMSYLNAAAEMCGIKVPMSKRMQESYGDRY